MKEQYSIRTRRKYPTRMILQVVEMSSAGYYESKKVSKNKSRPGPKPEVDDQVALEAIRDEVNLSKFTGEGYKKIHARLRKKGIKLGKHRVLRLMRRHDLLSPTRPRHNGSCRIHNGTITTDKPNEMWGTDGKRFFTQKEGWCWFFGVIDHCTAELISHVECKFGNRFRALDALKAAVKKEFGGIQKGICQNKLDLRCDHGSQFDSNDYQRELKYLGIRHSPAFVRSPECNGIIERFHRTLEEQVLAVNQFETLEEASEKIKEFTQSYNKDWILHKHGCLSPLEYKEKIAA